MNKTNNTILSDKNKLSKTEIKSILLPLKGKNIKDLKSDELYILLSIIFRLYDLVDEFGNVK